MGKKKPSVEPTAYAAAHRQHVAPRARGPLTRGPGPPDEARPRRARVDRRRRRVIQIVERREARAPSHAQRRARALGQHVLARGLALERAGGARDLG